MCIYIYPIKLAHLVSLLVFNKIILINQIDYEHEKELFYFSSPKKNEMQFVKVKSFKNKKAQRLNQPLPPQKIYRKK